MSLLPPAVVIPFYGQPLQPRMGVTDANGEIAGLPVPKQSKPGRDAPVSSGYITTGFLSFLWLLGPGPPPLEAILW
jgi:hypothetical protein